MKYFMILLISLISIFAQAGEFDWMRKWRATQTKCERQGEGFFEGDWINLRYGKDISLYREDPRYGRAILLEFPWPGNAGAALSAYDDPTEYPVPPPNFARRELTKNRFFFHSKSVEYESYANIEMINSNSARAELIESGPDTFNKISRMRCTHILIAR